MRALVYLTAYSLFIFLILFSIRLFFHLETIPIYFFAVAYACLHFGLLVLSFYVTKKVWMKHLFNPPPSTRVVKEVTPEYYRIPFEKIEIESKDGTKIKGWFISSKKKGRPFKQSKGTIIVCHGITSSRYFHLPRSIFFYYLGYNILLFDLRTHGHSEGEFVTFGYKEQDDIEAVVYYIKNRKDIENKKIALVGHSMGAATAILLSAKKPLLDALISIACYSSVEEDMDYWVTHIAKLPKFPFVYFGKKMFRDALKIDFKLINPIDHIQDIKTPVFFLHGTKDDVSPYRSSERLFEKAREPKKLWIIENAKHETLYENAGREFERRIRDFLNEHMR